MIDTDRHVFLPGLHSLLSAPCAYANRVTLNFSRPGKPADNAYIEAFNARLRACPSPVGQVSEA